MLIIKTYYLIWNPKLSNYQSKEFKVQLLCVVYDTLFIYKIPENKPN